MVALTGRDSIKLVAIVMSLCASVLQSSNDLHCVADFEIKVPEPRGEGCEGICS